MRKGEAEDRAPDKTAALIPLPSATSKLIFLAGTCLLTTDRPDKQKRKTVCGAGNAAALFVEKRYVDKASESVKDGKRTTEKRTGERRIKRNKT